MTTLKATSRRRGRRPGNTDETGHTGETGATNETGDSGSPAEDWNAISVGSTVEVILTDGYSYVGRVDAKTPDSGVVWVVSFTDLGRQMYESHDGVRLRPAAKRTL
jgi:hypothetical protein